MLHILHFKYYKIFCEFIYLSAYQNNSFYHTFFPWVHSFKGEVGGNINVKQLLKKCCVFTTDKAEDLSFNLNWHINTVIYNNIKEK